MRYIGMGVVSKEGEPVAEVEYDLVRTVHYVTLGPDDRREGLSEIHGEIVLARGTKGARGTGGAIDLGQTLLLRMQDGRVVSFFVNSRSDEDCPRYSVVVAGDPGQ